MNGTGITAAQDDRDVFSIGNQFTVANAISLAGTSGRILSTDDTTVSPSSIATTAPTLPGLAPNYNRAIFEVPLNATADQVQATINAAVASQSPNAVVHLPAGSYQIDHTLTVPANAQIQIAGDSQATELWWTGTSPTGPVVSLTGPSYATLRDLAIVGGTVTAISLSGADQTGGRVFESASYMSPLSVTGLSHTRVDAQANTGISGLIATSSASVLLVGSGGVPMSLLGNSQVLISDCWFEGTRSNLLTLESGNLTYLGGLLAPYADGYGAGLPPLAPLMTINDYSGQLSVIGVSLNLRSGSNGILVTSASPATQALFLGLSTNATNFFTNDVTADSVGAILSKQSAGAGAYDVADAGDTSSAFVVAGLAQARSVIWETSPMVHTEGTTDVRLFRIATPNTAIGLSVSN
jgi:hypothetical protein